MNSPLTRRRFLAATVKAAAVTRILSYAGPSWAVSPNEKLNVAVVGIHNQGRFNLDNVTHENVVALCDVDESLLAEAAKVHPGAKLFHDYRRLLDEKNLDAVVVATPDHTHAVITAGVLSSGRHAYCEKPLARTIQEARVITDLARKHNRVTQIGTQIHAGVNYRRVVELVQSGAIGEVREVHVWVGGGFGGKKRPTETPPIPAGLHYDLWLGPAPERPYHPDYLPFTWRNWWVFGGGTLADLGCHHIDLSHWALNLRWPLRVKVVDGPAPDPECPPPWLIVEYQYGARAQKPPVTLRWYHGDKRPPQFAEGRLPKWGNGTLFVGSKGMLLADYGSYRLLPETDFAGFTPPAPFIPDSIGHHREWTEACKRGGPTTCAFDYSGPLTETVLLGNVAHRTGRELVWDPVQLRASNCPEADEFIRFQGRPGWRLL
ncbi:MAG: Gfo/Idh/MocA family oxidoreductase [Pedosphaera sp.]|nr:Gfo/Idh/MocA family oxidoreductase [Pedosphaera sp.]